MFSAEERGILFNTLKSPSSSLKVQLTFWNWEQASKQQQLNQIYNSCPVLTCPSLYKMFTNPTHSTRPSPPYLSPPQMVKVRLPKINPLKSVVFWQTLDNPPPHTYTHSGSEGSNFRKILIYSEVFLCRTLCCFFSFPFHFPPFLSDSKPYYY